MPSKKDKNIRQISVENEFDKEEDEELISNQPNNVDLSLFVSDFSDE